MRFLKAAWKHHTWFLLALLLAVARYREPQLAPQLRALPVELASQFDEPDLKYIADCEIAEIPFARFETRGWDAPKIPDHPPSGAKAREALSGAEASTPALH